MLSESKRAIHFESIDSNHQTNSIVLDPWIIFVLDFSIVLVFYLLKPINPYIPLFLNNNKPSFFKKLCILIKYLIREQQRVV